MIWPKISIVTPSYNQGLFIENTIISILNQNYPNLEYIIIDGGSTDQTIDIIRKYQSRIAYWVSEPDNGQTDAINKGFKKCTGEIFNWINSDDYLEPNALVKIGEEFKKGYEVVCGKSNVVSYPSGNITADAGTSVYPSLSKTISWVKNHQPATFYKLDQIGEFFPLSEKLHYTMDQELWIKYLCKYGQEKIKTINDKVVNFRVHESSKTGVDKNFDFIGLPYLFFKDYNSIFYSISAQLRQDSLSMVITSMFKANDKEVEDYVFPLSRDYDKQKMVAVLHYYLFRLLVDEYPKGNIQKCKLLLRAIDASFFEKKDIDAFKNLRFRVFFYPIIKILKIIFRRK